MINKKAVSLMVSYTLLIVIGISLAALVYTFLKARLPSEKIECPADISLSIESLNCTIADKTLTIQMYNRGLFNITGVFVRFAESNRTVRQQINAGKEVYLKGLGNSPLAPGESTTLLSYSLSSVPNLAAGKYYTVEIQPAVFRDNSLIPCANTIATQTIKCV